MVVLGPVVLPICPLPGQKGRCSPWGPSEPPGAQVPSHKALPSHSACHCKDRAVSESVTKCQVQHHCKIQSCGRVSALKETWL